MKGHRPRKPLPPVHPNAGIECAYRRRLDALIAQMHNSVVYWLSAGYRANPPVFAQDDLPAQALRKIIAELSKRWQRRFNDLSQEMAVYFATNVHDRVDGALSAMLAKYGFAIRFRMTRTMRDALAATVGENVALIRSIPQKYFTDIQTEVMRSAAAGRDLKTLTDFLGPKVDLARIRMGERPGESSKSYLARTWRRAALIARDQNNKATATMIRTRQADLGITQAIWMHSGGGHEPRPDHVAWGREKKRYDVENGMWSEVEQKWIYPGELINCRCTSRSIIPGLPVR
jgi:uncharacterized protein with gpF-like domain